MGRGRMSTIKMTCNYCGTTAEGFKQDLLSIGWVTKQVIQKGQYVTKTACPAHTALIINK
jgi:hypothetical protein